MKCLLLEGILLVLISLSLFGCSFQKKGSCSSQLERESTDFMEASNEDKIERKVLTTLSFPSKILKESPKTSFFLTLKLPYDWKVEVGAEARERALVSTYYLYNETSQRIGLIGYAPILQDVSKDKESPETVYKSLLSDSKRRIDLVEQYEILNATYEGNTAFTELFYQTSEKEGKDKKFYAVLAFNRVFSSVVLMELDPDFVKKEEAKDLAKSLLFR